MHALMSRILWLCRCGRRGCLLILAGLGGMLGAPGTALAQDAPIRVGIYNNAPRIFMDGGVPAGIMVDLLREVARAELWRLEFVPCDWQDCLDALEAGRIDLLPGAVHTPEREAVFDFHQTPALHGWSQLYTRPQAGITSVHDLKDKRIAVLAGGVQVQAVVAMMSAFGVPVTLVPVKTLEDVFAAVGDQRADAGVVNNHFGDFYAGKAGLVETPVIFQPVKLFYATRKDQHPGVRQVIDVNLSRWQAQPDSVYFETVRKWRSETELAATPRRLWFIMAALGLLALVAVGVGLYLVRTVWVKNRLARVEHARMQAILEAMPDLLFEVGLDGTYFDCHSPRAELLVAEPAQLLGKTVAQVMPPDAASTILAALQDANRNGHTGGHTIRLGLPAGARWFELSVAKKNGEPDAMPRFIVLSRDITQRHDAQAALRASEETYRAMFEASPVPYMLCDRDQNIRQVNHAFEQCFGYQLHDIPSLEAWRNQAYPDAEYRAWVLANWGAQMARYQHDGTRFEPVPLRVCAKNGQQRSVLATAIAASGPLSGQHLIMLYDITETVRAEERVQGMRMMMERTEHLAHIASWEWDVDANRVTWSPEMFRIFGREPEDITLTLQGQSALYPPPDVKKLMDAVQRALHEGQPYELSLDIVLPDGSLRPCYIKGFPERNAAGRVVRLAGLLQDITERKHEEERNRLAVSVFANAREGIVITDAQATIVDANASYSRITGYTREELLGSNPRLLKSGRQSPDFYQQLWEKLRVEGFWEGELWNRRKDGAHFAEHLTISAVHNAAGKTQNYVGIATDVTADHEYRRQLEHVAYHDRLTGLPNRVLLADRLDVAMAQCLRHEQVLAVVYLDLDGFKAVNDVHGHETGDRMLIEISNRMKNVLRESDTLSRMGGDEFVAVLTELANVGDCEPILGRLLEAAAEPVGVDGLLLRVSASMGVTVFPVDKVDADQLLRHADQAMYVAKQAGKNRHHFFDIEQETAVKLQREGVEYIRQALDQRELVLHYQPKVNIRTGAVVGAEALIRWQHPQRGLLAPGAFLPMVEGHAMGVVLGEWVISTALDQLSAWNAAGLELSVSVNVGAQQLQHKLFVQRLAQALVAHPDVRPGQLELEILETNALEDVAQISQLMHACLGLGVSFALDDFGTGYSSLTYLKRLPAALLKIDQSFVRDMLTDPDDLAIVQGVIGLAGVFRRAVIAEGVETQAHGAKLLELGCDQVQGYGVARPMPAADFPAWVAQWRARAQWTA